MKLARQTVASALVVTLIALGLPSVSQAKVNKGFTVEDAGGSLSSVNTGETLHMTIASNLITISKSTLIHENPNMESAVHRDNSVVIQFTPSQVTGLSYGSEQHHRIGTAVAVGFLSLGAGLIVACTKSKKHFIGINWDADGVKGGIALRVDKSEYRGIIAALQGVTGKTVLDTDQTVATKLGVQ